MRAIVNGKLYDTEKSNHNLTLCLDGILYEIHHTKNGNIFAVNISDDIILDSERLKVMLDGRPECVDSYMEIFGMPEEA